MLDLLVSSPWRPPDAWWQRATRLVTTGDPRASAHLDSGRGCKWIKDAQRYQHAVANAQTFEQQKQLIIDYTAIFYADWIFQQATTSNRAVRWALEARILARQSNEEISVKNGVWPEAVEAYEALFFNVRDRLYYSDYILNSVLGQVAISGLQPRDNGLLCKMMGYLSGPHVLDAMISHIPNPAWANSAEGVASYFQDTAISLMKKKASHAALTVPVESHTQMHLIEAFVKYVEIERNSDSLGEANDQIQQGLQNLLESLPFAAIGVTNQKQLPPLDTCAAEMRSDELMLTTVGMEMPGAEFLKQLRFPEQVTKT